MITSGTVGSVNILETYDDAWTGTNGFRLMPDDPLEARPAAATLSHVAGGHLTSLHYRWEHPTDGSQDGLLLVWTDDRAETAHAMWGDSWHQQPAPMHMSGRFDETTIYLDAGYGDEFRWRIVVEATDAETLRMLMHNVVPAKHASNDIPGGAYPVMVTELNRAR
jgi:hypothetical protein